MEEELILWNLSEDELLTMGDLPNLTLTNRKDEIVARFYILPDGNLHPDSWIRDERHFYPAGRQ